MKQIRIMTALIAGMLLFCTNAFAVTLLSENFDSVTGIGTTERTLQSILATSSSELAAGTSWSVTTPATAASVNVRHTDNRINSATIGIERFYDAFTPINNTNNFLVLGDDSSNINNAPFGGVSSYSVPFATPAATGSIRVKFDYAFNGWDNATGGHNKFRVYLSDGTNNKELLDFSSPAGTGRPAEARGSNYAQGPYNQLVDISTLTGSNFTLHFVLDEGSILNNIISNAAVGADNILITSESTSVPEPSTFMLLGAGIAGIAFLKRRRG